MVMTESNVRLNNLVENGVEVFKGTTKYQPLSQDFELTKVVVAIYNDGGRESAMRYGGVRSGSTLYEPAFEMLQNSGINPKTLSGEIELYIHTLEHPSGDSFQFRLPSLKYFDQSAFEHLEPIKLFDEAMVSAYQELDILNPEVRQLMDYSLDDMPWENYGSVGLKARESLKRHNHLSAEDVWILFRTSDPPHFRNYSQRSVDTTRNVFRDIGIELPVSMSR